MIPIIIEGSSEDGLSKVSKLFPSTQFDYTHISADKSSITIAQIHDLLKSLSISSSRPRLIVIHQANLITLPAQNALLKILEEPPANCQFALLLDNHRSLISTIISRCSLLHLELETTPGTGQELQLIKQALSATPGERITLSRMIGKKREDALTWCLLCLRDIEYKLRIEQSPSSVKILAKIGRLVHNAYLDLKGNISTSLVLQNLFLSLPIIRTH